MRSTLLTVKEETIISAFRRHTLSLLDDGLYGLQPAIPASLPAAPWHQPLARGDQRQVYQEEVQGLPAS
jgi:hypothetical protein